MAIDLFLIVLCIVGSGFASGSETALISASRTRLQHLTSNGLHSAKRAMDLVKDREKILIVMLIANNVFNITAGALATIALSRWIGPLGPVVATLAMTSVLLIIGEIVPKAYVCHHAEHTLVRAAPVWRAFSWLMMPVSFPIRLFTRVVLSVCHCELKSVYKTRDELRLVIVESGESGGLQRHQQEMLESTLKYSTTIVREVMVPISEVALLPETAQTKDCLALVREQGHTRIPVYRDRVDQIVGLINVFDILYDGQRPTFIRPHMRPIRIVPETKAIDQLFIEMQRDRERLAVVVNEFGACFGIVTLEDIMEEIFGELADEHEDATLPIQETAPGHFRVSAMIDIDDFREETGINLPKDGFETVGGYVLYRLGRIPRKGDAFCDGKVTVRIVEADRYSVKTVEILREEAVDTDEEAVP